MSNAEEMFKNSEVRLHEITFGEDVFVIKYTHMNEVCEEAAITKEVHIPYATTSDQIQHWVTEFMEDAHELVQQTEIMIRQINRGDGMKLV